MTEAWRQWEGQVVNGKFPLTQYLGGSEHSAVFQTTGDREGQRAAIKLVSADPAGADRQLAQWNLASQLAHPHLIRLLHNGRCQMGDTKYLFVVMEYAAENLSQVLPQRPLTPAEARDLLDPALDALAYLHATGVVHGHLKPANIMAVDERLKLSTDRLYRSGESVAEREPGSYDAPERTATPAGDVWSLGMILAEALTRRLLAWEKAGGGDPALPEGIPAQFSEIVRNCLRQDPQRRWTVAEIAARLRQTPSRPAEATPVGSLARAATPKWLVPAAVAGVALVVLFGGWRLLRPAPEREPVAPAAMQPSPQPGSEPRAEAPETKPVSRTAAPARNPESDVIHQVIPDVPASARATITGKVKVRVRVHVDATGNVAGAEFVSPGPSQYFARLGMQAAQRWKFAPVPSGDGETSREWVLRFEFGRAGTKVIPARVSR